LVRVVKGIVFDVVVDLRRDSLTFGSWAGTLLSGEHLQSLWVPPGFAHGFLVLSDSADLLCDCSDFWEPTAERAILWNDPDLGVAWPLPAGASPILSARDATASGIGDAEYYPAP
jgi:dTDP-4-dehydrorhamnose 3,5-epimerase